MNIKLRIGIIGCGTIANGKHLPCLTKQEEVEIVGLCDLEKEKAEKAAAQFDLQDAKLYTNYQQLLADESIDVVHICVPNKTHCEVAVAAFEAGKHVFCEKPLAANADDGQKMITAWEKTDRKFTVGYQWRFRLEMLYLKKLIEEGELGDIYFARATSIRRCGAPNWGAYLDKKKQGGGALIDSGSHSIDLTLWLMNNYDVKSVNGKVFNKLADRPEGNINGPWDPKDFTVDDSAFGQVHFGNGAVMFIEAAWLLNVGTDIYHIPQFCGTKAGADFLDRYALTLHKMSSGKPVDEKADIPGASPWLWRPGQQGLYEAEHWVKTILEDMQPEVSPYQALTVCKIVDAIYSSSDTGTSVCIN